MYVRLAVASSIAAAAILGFAAPAGAEPSIYDPEITPCGDMFRLPWEAPRPGTSPIWSPWGTANIVCVNAGYTPYHVYQRDTWGSSAGTWHHIEQFPPGNYFYNPAPSSLPGSG